MRPLAFAGLALPLLVLLLPGALAALTVQEVDVPPRTAALKPFEVNVTIANDGPARSVYLFAALYERVEGAGPCGPATDPRFRTFTHLVQEPVRLEADAATTYPAAGARWLHRYSTEDAPPDPEVAEFCVFVANATRAEERLQYEAYASVPLSVRAVNAAPQVSFTWSPERPAAAADATFRAEGQDAEGDPIEFTWDFGHFDASGRDRGRGASATTSFFPAGEYVVTLTGSDGLDATSVSRTIVVADAASGDGGRDGIPGPGLALLLAAAALALLAARRR